MYELYSYNNRAFQDWTRWDGKFCGCDLVFLIDLVNKKQFNVWTCKPYFYYFWFISYLV